MTSNDPELRDDDCVTHDRLGPLEAMARYMSERDPHAGRDIARYVGLEAGDETVQHVEKVKVEYVVGDPYEIWDVVTDKNRRWVITNPTNLYSQKDFPSFDYVLSFHVGLMMRLQSRSQGSGVSNPHPLNAVARRREQAE